MENFFPAWISTTLIVFGVIVGLFVLFGVGMFVIDWLDRLSKWNDFGFFVVTALKVFVIVAVICAVIVFLWLI